MTKSNLHMEHWSLSDGNVSTTSFSRNQMTSLSQIKTDRTVHVNNTKSKRKLYSAYMSSNVVRSSHYTDLILSLLNQNHLS